MKEDLRKKLWQVAREYDTKEDTHGADFHIRRMIETFNIFRQESSLSSEIMDAVEAGIICHDVGLKEARENHSIISVRILTDLIKRGSLKGLPNAGWVLYAISKHSKGLKMSKDPSPSQICASMLILFDHMDAIGAMGVYRSIRFNPGKPLFPPQQNNGFNRKIDECLINPEGVNVNSREMLEFKRSSLLGGLAFNHAVSYCVIERAEPFISGSETEREYLSRKEFLFEAVVKLRKEAFHRP